MKAMKCYCCEERLMPVVDDCYRTVIPNPEVEGGKEVICQDCAEQAWIGSNSVVISDGSLKAFNDCRKVMLGFISE